MRVIMNPDQFDALNLRYWWFLTIPAMCFLILLSTIGTHGQISAATIIKPVLLIDVLNEKTPGTNLPRNH